MVVNTGSLTCSKIWHLGTRATLLNKNTWWKCALATEECRRTSINTLRTRRSKQEVCHMDWQVTHPLDTFGDCHPALSALHGLTGVNQILVTDRKSCSNSTSFYENEGRAGDSLRRLLFSPCHSLIGSFHNSSNLLNGKIYLNWLCLSQLIHPG